MWTGSKRQKQGAAQSALTIPRSALQSNVASLLQTASDCCIAAVVSARSCKPSTPKEMCTAAGTRVTQQSSEYDQLPWYVRAWYGICDVAQFLRDVPSYMRKDDR